MAEYIDKAEALSRFSFYNGDRIPERDVDGFPNTITFHDAKAVIQQIRPADVRPVVRGRWEIVTGSNGKEYMVCSECRVSQTLTGTFSYCPNCGADMRGGGKE